MLRFTCDCGRVLGYQPQHVGKKVRCSGCQKVLVIPDQDVVEVEAVEVEAVEEEPRPASRRRDEDEGGRIRAEREDDRPRKPSRRDEEVEDVEAVEEVEEVKRPRSRRDEEDAEDAG